MNSFQLSLTLVLIISLATHNTAGANDEIPVTISKDFKTSMNSNDDVDMTTDLKKQSSNGLVTSSRDIARATAKIKGLEQELIELMELERILSQQSDVSNGTQPIVAPPNPVEEVETKASTSTEPDYDGLDDWHTRNHENELPSGSSAPLPSAVPSNTAIIDSTEPGSSRSIVIGKLVPPPPPPTAAPHNRADRAAPPPARGASTPPQSGTGNRQGRADSQGARAGEGQRRRQRDTGHSHDVGETMKASVRAHESERQIPGGAASTTATENSA